MVLDGQVFSSFLWHLPFESCWDLRKCSRKFERSVGGTESTLALQDLWNGRSRVYGLFSKGSWGCLIFNCLVRKLYKNLWSHCILKCAAFRITHRRALPFSYTYNAHYIHSCHTSVLLSKRNEVIVLQWVIRGFWSSIGFDLASISSVWLGLHHSYIPLLYTNCDCHICFQYCMYCICMLEMPCDVSHYLFFNAMYFYIGSPLTFLFLFHAMWKSVGHESGWKN